MTKFCLALTLILALQSPCTAETLRPTLQTAQPETGLAWKDKHPLLYKAGWPVRKAWNSCIWIGEQSKPIHPFLYLCSQTSGITAPFIYGFFRR